MTNTLIFEIVQNERELGLHTVHWEDARENWMIIIRIKGVELYLNACAWTGVGLQDPEI
jgi:hypothetical protein